MNKLLILFLFLVTSLSAYEFAPGNFTIFTGYKTSSFSWYYDKYKTTSIEEKFKDFSLYNVGVNFEYLIADTIYIKANFDYSCGSSSNITTNMTILAENSTKSIATNITGSFKDYGSFANCYNTTYCLGYHMRFGPLFLTPNIGFAYNHQSLQRKNVNEYSYNSTYDGTTIVACFFPKGNVTNDWYSSIFGVNILLYPFPMGRIGMRCDYSFYIGKCHQQSEYFCHTDITPTTLPRTINNVTSKMKVDPISFANILNFKIFYGISHASIWGISLSYESFSTQKTNGDYTSTGNEQTIPGNDTPISLNQTKKLDKLTLENFVANIFLSLQF
jgi:hypothetical protein